MGGHPLGEDRLRSSGNSSVKHNVATLTGVGMETGVISYAGKLTIQFHTYSSPLLKNGFVWFFSLKGFVKV